MTRIIISSVIEWKQRMKRFYLTIKDFLPGGRVFEKIQTTQSNEHLIFLSLDASIHDFTGYRYNPPNTIINARTFFRGAYHIQWKPVANHSIFEGTARFFETNDFKPFKFFFLIDGELKKLDANGYILNTTIHWSTLPINTQVWWHGPLIPDWIVDSLPELCISLTD